MARVPDNEVIYKVAETFKQRCLIDDSSFLWPDQQAWTVANLQAFWDAFVGHPDDTSKSFIEKWAEQLAEQTEDVIRTASDITAFYGLFPAKRSLGTVVKTNLVRQVQQFRPEMNSPDPDTWKALVQAFEHEGVGSTGTHYNTGRPYQMAFYLGFALQLKNEVIDPSDWRACKDLADRVKERVRTEYGQSPSLGRNIILHLLFPEYFEDTASDDQKRRMLDAFREAADVPADSDVDEGLFAVRKYLERKYDRQISFYDPDIKSIWDGGPFPPPPPPPPDPLQELVRATYLDTSFLLEIDDLLSAKRQLIIEGPPGSGKTFVAEKFARWFTGQPVDDTIPLNDQVEIVQFHQSYGYEDFVQGIRPRTNEHGQLVYVVEKGIFLQMCQRAAEDSENPYVLIIDEINRGNLSRVFGELLLLLEYRGMKVRLPYDASYLEIPKNLYIIGTMNTADRSLAQIDYALRRRFYFVRFMPVENGRAEVYENWLARNVDDEADRKRLAGLFIALNHGIRLRLDTDDLQVGHSYFMQPGIETDVVFDRVWRRAVRPLLEEYLHHHRQRDEILADLTPERLRPAPASMASDDANAMTDATEPGQV